MTMSDYRKQGPKRAVERVDKVHPDFFWSMSGGLDSTAAYLVTRRALHENFSKRPVMTYWDTRVGAPLNRIYLEELADRYDEMLWSLRTHEKLEDWVAENDGCPGGGAHPNVRNILKGRQAWKLAGLADFPVYILGLRAGESDDRAEMDKVEDKDRHVEVRPVHRLSRRECARIVLEAEDCPINPFWVWPNCFSDCGCLANGDPSELECIEEKFPWFGQRMREIEEAADADGLRSNLGWDGLTSIEKQAEIDGEQQMTLCGSGCGRKRDPLVVEAFSAVIEGAPRERGLEILNGGDADGSEALVA